MKTARILLGILVGMIALTILPSRALALDQLIDALDTMSDSRPSVSSTHVITFEVPATSGGFTVKLFKIQFCKEAYGDNGTCTVPTGFEVDTERGVGPTTLVMSDSGAVLDETDYTITTAGGNIVWASYAAGDAITAGQTVELTIDKVNNNSVAGCLNNPNSSAGTCYVRVYLCTSTVEGTCDSTSGTPTIGATTIVSYTVIEAVTVSARVDPYFTFKVEGVLDHSAVLTNTGAITNPSVDSDYNTLPFGHLTPLTPKYAAHKLTVTMNTTSGYTVNMKMLEQMTGVYTANNIDPYTAGDSLATYQNPEAWVTPLAANTTPNVDTGWIGYNTDNAGVNAVDSFAGGLYAPVPMPTDTDGGVAHATTARNVMSKATSDDGTTPTYVTYAIEVNVNQPADTYTGTIVYNALPTY